MTVPVLILGADVARAPRFPDAPRGAAGADPPGRRGSRPRSRGAPHTIHDTAAVRGEYVERLLAFLCAPHEALKRSLL